jgi:hypothetical protein
MDDAGARWSAAVVRSRGALRLEKRDRGGALLWSGEWGFQGDYRFSAAVTPGGEALFAASSGCDGDPGCADALSFSGGAAPVRGSAVVRLGTGGEVRWVRRLSGVLAGADADGGAALAGSHPTGSASYLAVKLDASGITRWTREITSLLSLRLDRTGDLLAVGCYQDDRSLLDGIPCQRGVTAARLAGDGTTLWSTGGLDGYWPAIDTTADGTGYAVTRAFTLTALAPDGAVRWSRKIGESPRFGNQRGDAVAVAAAANGPVAVAGYGIHPAPGRLTPAVILGFDAAGSPTFVDEAPFDQPSAMVYGADGELLVAVPGGGVDAPGGHVDGAVVIELTP